tara:strand:- start:830 stop:1525 length:696 start_codon:yes stop_codon:yes gene_type:complete
MFIFTKDNLSTIKNAVYSSKSIPNKHTKKIKAIKDGAFADFNYSKFKVNPISFPPVNTAMTTYNELQYLLKLPFYPEYVKEHDDIEKVFEEVCKENNVKYPRELVDQLLGDSAGIILDLKYTYNRPRPAQLAPHYNIKLNSDIVKLPSMKTPSYPSGHSAQGILIGKVLHALIPLDTHTDAFLEAGKRISYSRAIGRAHYPSDTNLGEEIGEAMFKYIMKTQKLNTLLKNQ